MTTMWTWFRFILTDEKNQWEIGILLWLVYNGMYLYRSAMAPWDPVGFATGAAALLAGGGGMRWILRQIKEDDHVDRVDPS